MSDDKTLTEQEANLVFWGVEAHDDHYQQCATPGCDSVRYTLPYGIDYGTGHCQQHTGRIARLKHAWRNGPARAKENQQP